MANSPSLLDSLYTYLFSDAIDVTTDDEEEEVNEEEEKALRSSISQIHLHDSVMKLIMLGYELIFI